MKKFFSNILRKFYREDNLTIIKYLIFFNILQSNPVFSRKNVYKGSSLYNENKVIKKIMRNKFIISPILILIIYGGIILGIDFKKTPMYLDFFVLMYSLVTMTLFFGMYYYSIFESKDFSWYAPIPIKEETIFRIKYTIVYIDAMQIYIPILPAFFLFYLRNNLGIFNTFFVVLLGLFYSILAYLMFCTIIVHINIVITELMSKTVILTKMKNSILNIVNIVGISILILFIIGLQNGIFISKISILSTSPSNYIGIGSLLNSPIGNIVLVVLLVLCVYLSIRFKLEKMGKNYYSYMYELNNNLYSRKNKRNKKSISDVSSDTKEFDKTRRFMSDVSSDTKAISDSSISVLGVSSDMKEVCETGKSTVKISDNTTELKNDFKFMGSKKEVSKNDKLRGRFGIKIKTMLKYNFSTLKKSNVFSTAVFSPVLLSFVVFVPMFKILADKSNLIENNKINFILVLVICISGYVSSRSNTLFSIAFSLEGENYEFMKSLPISRKMYFVSKLFFCSIVMCIMEAVVLGIFELVIGLGIGYILLSIVLLFFLISALGTFWCMYDYKNAMTEWQNITELFNRESKVVQFLKIFISIVVISAFLGFSVYSIIYGQAHMIRNISIGIYVTVVSLGYLYLLYNLKYNIK